MQAREAAAAPPQPDVSSTAVAVGALQPSGAQPTQPPICITPTGIPMERCPYGGITNEPPGGFKSDRLFWSDLASSMAIDWATLAKIGNETVEMIRTETLRVVGGFLFAAGLAAAAPLIGPLIAPFLGPTAYFAARLFLKGGLWAPAYLAFTEWLSTVEEVKGDPAKLPKAKEAFARLVRILLPTIVAHLVGTRGRANAERQHHDNLPVPHGQHGGRNFTTNTLSAGGAIEAGKQLLPPPETGKQLMPAPEAAPPEPQLTYRDATGAARSIALPPASASQVAEAMPNRNLPTPTQSPIPDFEQLPVPAYSAASLPADIAWDVDPSAHLKELGPAARYVGHYAEKDTSLPSNYRQTYLDYLRYRWKQPIGHMDARDNDLDASGQLEIVKRISSEVKTGLKQHMYSEPTLPYARQLVAATARAILQGRLSVSEFDAIIDLHLTCLPDGLDRQGQRKPVRATGAFRDQRPPTNYFVGSPYEDAFFDLYNHSAPLFVTHRELVDQPAIADATTYSRRDFTAKHEALHDELEAPYPQFTLVHHQGSEFALPASSSSFHLELPTIARQIHFKEKLWQRFDITDGPLRNDVSSHVKLIYFVNAHEIGESRLPERMQAYLQHARNGRHEIASTLARLFRDRRIAVDEAEIQASIDEFLAFTNNYVASLKDSEARSAEATFSVRIDNLAKGQKYLRKVIGNVKLHTGSRYPRLDDYRRFLNDDTFKQQNDGNPGAYQELLDFVNNY